MALSDPVMTAAAAATHRGMAVGGTYDSDGNGGGGGDERNDADGDSDDDNNSRARARATTTKAVAPAPATTTSTMTTATTMLTFSLTVSSLASAYCLQHVSTESAASLICCFHLNYNVMT
uniref:Uncharacterized protein n=1 Tax=Oryza brachyantha TaxID=4533 RepID=J3M2H8_ORYBR